MTYELNGSPSFDGYRGSPAVDCEEIVAVGDLLDGNEGAARSRSIRC